MDRYIFEEGLKKWGISFDEGNPYTLPERENKKVEYAEKKDLIEGIRKKYPQKAANDSGGVVSPGNFKIHPEPIPGKLKPLRTCEETVSAPLLSHKEFALEKNNVTEEDNE